MLAIARKEAQVIVNAANSAAEQCSARADEQAEQLKQQAHDEGYQNGLAQGLQVASDEMRQNIDKSIEKSQTILSITEQEAKEMIFVAERQIIEIALAVARRILAREIEENPMAVLPIVKNALEKVRDQEQVTARVSPDDFDVVLLAKRDLEIMMGRERALTIMADRTIDPGGCMIDTAYGTVDARLDIKFEMLAKALREVLP